MKTIIGKFSQQLKSKATDLPKLPLLFGVLVTALIATTSSPATSQPAKSAVGYLYSDYLQNSSVVVQRQGSFVLKNRNSDWELTGREIRFTGFFRIG